MWTPRRAIALPFLAIAAVFALVISLIPQLPAYAAVRPFPKYDMTFQKISGTKVVGESPEDTYCVRDANPTYSHLTTFGFKAMLNECEGARITIRFYYDKPFGPGEDSTLNFRFGTVWQYRPKSDLDQLIMVPVENFLYDGAPVSREQYDPDNPALLDKDGNPVRMSDGDGWYEPYHYVFEDEFGEGEEHTIQYDVFAPIGFASAGVGWGTGSTGDTQGGSIGATANALRISPPAQMDFRYVLHSEYLQARGLQEDDLVKDLDYGPGLPEREWVTSAAEVKDEKTPFELIQCLEEQQLRDMRDTLPLNQIRYPEPYDQVTIPYTTETRFEDRQGNYGLARWPYEFSVFQDGNWDPKTGLRPMHRDGTQFNPYLNADGTMMSLPYKPTLASLQEDIPGYEYVDNDLPIFKKGEYVLDQPAHSYNFKPAPNVYLRQVENYTTQHFYFTYRPIPGTFELEKSALGYERDGESGEYRAIRTPLAGATFKLFEVVDDNTTACGVTPDLSDTEVVEVCTHPEPNTPEELQAATETPGTCQTQRVRPITLEGTDGTFTTDAEGRFAPSGDPALNPGKYLLQEIAAPNNHVIVDEWTPFEIPPQIDEDAQPVKVRADNYQPGSFELVKTGVEYDWDGDSQGFVKSQVPLAGASFELFQPVADGSVPGAQEVSVCDYREPASVEELRAMLDEDPTGCVSQWVREVSLPGVDGAFVTDAQGRFTPPGDASLVPGDYLLRETAAPGDYQVLNEWVAFTVDGKGSDPVEVFAENYLPPTEPPTPTPTPEEPTTPHPDPNPSESNNPGEPEIPLTGGDGGAQGAAALLLFGAGIGLLALRRMRLT